MKGSVTTVRLFVDRAAITRRRTVSGGASEVHFEPIPLDADVATLRAQAVVAGDPAGKKLRVSGVTSSVVWSEVESAKMSAARAQIAELDKQVLELDDESGTASRANDLLHRYTAISTGTLSKEWLDKEPSFETWAKTFDHLRSRTAELAIDHAVRAQKRARLFEKKAEAMSEIDRLGKPEKVGYRVTVTLESPPASGSIAVDLTYVTPRAQWMPTYDVRHVAAAGNEPEHVTLSAVALVRQTTGEDWEQVELIATTARPPLSEPVPELRPINLTGAPRAPDKQVVSTTKAEAKLGGATGRAPVAGEQAMVEHVAPGRVSVPSSRRPVRVDLFEVKLPARTRLELAPMARPVAIRVAEIENRSGRVLLPGHVKLFRGANYSGLTQLDFVASGERFWLPLGTDATIRVKREVLAYPVKKTAITGSVVHAYDCRISLENLGGAPVDLVVKDRVPVSRAEDVSVKVTELDRAARLEEATGLTRQEVTLPPHTKRDLVTSFRITAPSGFHVSLPRDV